MTPITDSKLDLLIDSLAAHANQAAGGELHIAAFAGWLLSAPPESPLGLSRIAANAATHEGGARTYRDIAAIGFGLSNNLSHSEAFVEGLNWLSGRKFFLANRPRTFEADGVAILGLALGLRTLPKDGAFSSLRDWLRGFVSEVLKDLHGGTWDFSLAAAAAQLLSMAESEQRLDEQAVPELRVALAAKGVCGASDADERAALEAIVRLSHREAGPDRAATQLVALRWILRSTPTALPGRASVSEVANLLKAVPRALRMWTWESNPRTGKGVPTQWAIDNEYHVQHLLWVILAPLFPDLEDEENLPSIGHKRPRADLGIPSLKLIIEAKFIRKGNNSEFAALIGQIAEDANLYLTEPERYNCVIPFVWDNSRRSEQHAELEQGLRKIPNIVSVVVVSRPGIMSSAEFEVREARVPDDA